MLKGLETELRDSQKALIEQTTQSSSMISKQFETETSECFKRIFAVFKYKAVKRFGGLKKSFLKFTLGA